MLGVLNAILVLAAAGLLLFTARRLGLACTIALGLLLLLMVGDVGYVSYLNSIYSEPASLVSFLLLLAIGLRLILYEETGRRRLIWYGAFLASLVLLASAKPQNTILAILLAPLAYRLWPRPERGFRDPLRVGVVLALVGFAVWFASYSTPAVLRQLNLYNAVFNEILKFSDEPRADLRSLALDPDLAPLAGTNAFEPDVPITEAWFVAAFHDRIGYGDIVRFYATHPERFAELVDRTGVSTFRLRPPSYGNFPVSAGRPPRAQSESFDWWSDFGDDVLPRSDWFLGLFVLVNLLALGLKIRLDQDRGDRLLTELHAATLLVALYQFAAVSIGEGELDAVKHLFLFNVAADACVAFLALYTVALLRSRRQNPSPQPQTRATQTTAGTIV